MLKRARFWRALEIVPALSTAAIEWRTLLGEDWEWARPLLRQTGEVAEIVLVRNEPCRVIVHAPDRVTAVPLEGGAPRRLDAADVQILRVDARRVERLIGDALDLERGDTRSGPSLARELGRMRVTDTTPCAVRLCNGCGPDATQTEVFRLLAAADSPTIILTPRRIDGDDIQHVIRLRRCLQLTLEDALGVDEKGSVATTTEARHQLERFKEVVRRWESGDAPQEAFRFQRVGRIWLLAFENRACYIPHRDASGLAYVQHLVARPHQAIPVEDVEKMVSAELALDAIVSGEEVADREGLQRVWAEMRQLRADLDRARRENDRAAESRIQADLDALADQVRQMHGLNDRVRRIGDDVERLRTKVTNAIRRATRVLEDENSSLAAHLRALDLGKVMAYRPATDIPWVFC